MTKALPNLILNSLVFDEAFCRKALPHLKPDYFENEYRYVHGLILDFIARYNRLPNKAALEIELANSKKIPDGIRIPVAKFISEQLREKQEVDAEWLIDSTEKWCKDRAVYLAIMESISIIQGDEKNKGEGAIPEILSDALGVSFDTNIGHDYIANAEQRFDFYQLAEDKIPFHLDILNTITNGGISRKTLNVLLAGCVHPDTPITIRLENSTVEKTIAIGEVELLLRLGLKVLVSSPDGFVPVSAFVDKGEWDEYLLYDFVTRQTVRCNEKHLFQTETGWMFAEEMKHGFVYKVLGEDGAYHPCCVRKTGLRIPIVDITVDHPNHRYYTNGVSSHNTGVGKSLTMCDFAAHHLTDGHNVLYITLEMSEERIAERIDANLLDVDISELKNLSKEMFNSKVKKIAGKTRGRLIVKQYPTASAHSGHFRALLQELKLKKDFVPDIIYIDYINLCASARLSNMNGGSYGFVKAIAEELRGLAIEQNIVLITATQTTRSGYGSTDIELTDVSESFSLPATADLFLALISDENLEKLNQILVKQLKNRYNDLNQNKRFCVGIERSKMRLYDIEDPMANISRESTESQVVAQTPFAASQQRKQFTGFKV